MSLCYLSDCHTDSVVGDVVMFTGYAPGRPFVLTFQDWQLAARKLICLFKAVDSDSVDMLDMPCHVQAF